MHELIDGLRKIQVEWDLSVDKLAKLGHASEKVLAYYFSLSPEKLEELPSVPKGLELCIPLLAVYRNLQKKFSNVEEQAKWLFTEHADFGNFKPIEIMGQNSENLSWVSYYLDSSTRR